MAQTMRSSSLDATARSGDEAFDSSGIETASKLFFLGLNTRDDGHGEELFIDSAIEIKNLKDFSVGFGFREVGGVALLPKELAGTEEGFYRIGSMS